MHIQKNLEEFEEAFGDYSEAKAEKVIELTCPNCSRGPYAKIAIPGNREFRVCKVCNHRETVSGDK